MMGGHSGNDPQAMIRKRATAMWSLVLATACTSVTTPEGEQLGMASPEFRAYVEAVFREQNRVATELAFALESETLAAPDVASLEAAEQELLVACEGLNEVAIGRREGRDLGRLRQAAAARRAPQCQSAARDAAALLESIRQ
jgi:hypothetical protein